MSLSADERTKARDAYGWDKVEKDIALSTSLRIAEAVIFGGAYMKHLGVHPFDLVEWVHGFYRDNGTAGALGNVIGQAFRAGTQAVGVADAMRASGWTDDMIGAAMDAAGARRP